VLLFSAQKHRRADVKKNSDVGHHVDLIFCIRSFWGYPTTTLADYNMDHMVLNENTGITICQAKISHVV